MKKTVHWLPRVLSIIAICLVSMFAFDVFDDQLTMMQQITALLIHLIPSFILLILLAVAWRYKLTGGIIFTALGIVAGIFLFQKNIQMNHNVLMTLEIVALLALPFLISGILFMLDYKNIHKGHTSEFEAN